MKNSKEQKMIKKLEKAVKAWEKFNEARYQCILVYQSMTQDEWLAFCEKNDYSKNIDTMISDYVQ